MEETFERDDALGHLIHEEGLLKTSPGFTDRVMHLVNESPQRINVAYKPLLSRNAWILIAFGMVVLILVSLVGISGSTADVSYFERLKPVAEFISSIHISVKLESNMLMLASIIMASLGLLLLLDYFLNSRFRQITDN